MLEVKPFSPHVLAVGKQRATKDIVLVADIYHLVHHKRSIFHNFFCKEQYYAYNREVGTVYANCELDKTVFPNYKRVDTVAEVESAHDGILFVHDADQWFNSRDILFKKNNEQLLTLINNMGKRRLQGRFSAHRKKSVDVKLRSLMTLVIEPKPIVVGDWRYLDNYVSHYKVYDSCDKKIGEGAQDRLQEYAMLYDTEEEVKSIKTGGAKNGNAYAQTT